MQKKVIAVLRGGVSSEFDNSLKSGEYVLDTLEDLGHTTLDVFVDKNSSWFYKGVPVREFDILDKVDFVFNALHGLYGEDGQVQNILEKSGVPFNGPLSFDAATSFHRALAIDRLRKSKISKLEIQSQYFVNTLNLLDKGSKKISEEIHKSFAPPYIIKPVKSDPSFPISYVETPDKLLNSLEKFVMEYEEVVVEQFIYGTEISVSLIENFRDRRVYCTPALEIMKKDKKIFDYQNTYSEAMEEYVKYPAGISESEKERLYKLAEEIFIKLGARHYARADFMINKKGGIHLLRLRSLPGLSAKSLFPQSLGLVAVSFENFIEHVLSAK